MYKLVACDCDNTLLDSQANIPERNIKVIKKLIDKGIKVILATGRNDILVKDYILETGIDAPVIGCNGASVRNLKNDEVIKLTPIPTHSLEKVFDYCKEKGIRPKVFSMTHGYTLEDVSTGSLNAIFSRYKRVLKNNLIYESIDDMSELIGKTEIFKVLVVCDDEKTITGYQQDLQMIDGVDVVRSNNTCIDVGAKGVSKGEALKEYAEMCGIKPSEIVAFGDSENDLSMIEYAGYGVVMENGDVRIKEKADFITDTNDNAGVAQVLERLFADIL